MQGAGAGSKTATTVHVFLIADVRGYTAFTREHGDAAAARLAKRFADLARDAVEARSGVVIELRGDEALAVFESGPQAVRAGLELIEACKEETAQDPSLPLPVGIGIDAGEAIPVEGGFRGVALNMAARLCSKARAGQVLVSGTIAGMGADVEQFRFETRESVELKGFDQPVNLIEAIRTASDAAPEDVSTDWIGGSIPVELDTVTPLIGRDSVLHWLRGTWRQARRGNGRFIFVSGVDGIGKTRLCGELANELSGGGAVVRYAGAGGTAVASAQALLHEVATLRRPTLFVIDDLETYGEEIAPLLDEVAENVSSKPALIVGLIRDVDREPSLAVLVGRMDVRGDGHKRLEPLSGSDVREIAKLYVGDDAVDIPMESMLRASEGLPARIHEVVSEWARAEASRRLAAAAEFLAAGREQRRSDLEFANNVIGLKLGRLYSPERHELETDECPFKGLAYFDEADAGYFFGRERLVGELAARTVQFGLVGVVGASGSGKSSTLFAGLLPSLRAGLLPGSERWRMVSFRPGEHPLIALRDAITAASINEALERVGAQERLVIVVDQFEEVFTTCLDEDERVAFIDELVSAATKYAERVVVVIAMRGDFYGECATHRALAEMIRANHVLVGPMTQDELRRAIELPGRRAGLRVESTLTDELVSEVGGEPGGLPLLSTALVELWGARDHGWLRMDAYNQTGGLRGAVARLAESSYSYLSDEQQDVARHIFLRLAGPGEGDAVTKRRVAMREFDVDRDQATRAVVARLTQDRLLTISDGMVEVAHEALLREWPRLREWLDDDAHGRELRQHLTQAAQQWERSGRDQAELYRGARLMAALDWAGTHDRALNELERAFLAVGEEVSELERREAEERQRKELEDAQRVASAQRRSAHLLRGLAAVLVLGLVGSSVATVFALRSRSQAQEESRISRSRALAAAADAQLGVDPELSLLLAKEAAGSSPTTQAQTALRNALRESRVMARFDGHKNPVMRSSFTPDEKHIITRTGWIFSPASGLTTDPGDHAVRLWEPSGRMVWEAKGEPSEIFLSVVTSRDGAKVLASTSTGRIYTWARSDGKLLDSWKPDGLRGGWFQLSQDGRFMIGMDTPKGVPLERLGVVNEPFEWFAPAQVWETSAKRRVAVLQDSGFPVVFALLGDGKVVTFDSDLQGAVRDLATGRVMRTLESVPVGGETIGSTKVVVSRDLRRIARLGLTNEVVVWDAQSGRRVAGWNLDQISGSAQFSADGRVLVVTERNAAKVWNAETGELLATLAEHVGFIHAVSLSANGQRVVTVSEDQTARVWSIPSGDLIAVLRGHTNLLYGGEFNSDASRVITSSADGTARLWDLSDAGLQASFPNLRGVGASASFNSEGNLLATAGGKSAALIDLGAKKLVKSFSDPEDEGDWFWEGAALSRDGRTLVTSNRGGVIAIWDVSSGQRRHKIQAPAEGPGAAVGGPTYPWNSAVWNVSLSPDEKTFAAACQDGIGRIYDAESGALRTTLRGHEAGINDVAFSPDGKLLATGGDDGVGRIWDVATGSTVRELRGQTEAIYGIDWSSDGSRLATASFDGTVRVWDAANGTQVWILRGHSAGVDAAAFSNDGRWLATAADDGTMRVWDLRTGGIVQVFQGIQIGGDPSLSVSFKPGAETVIAWSGIGNYGLAGTLLLYECVLCADAPALMALAADRATRSLTEAEREQFLA